MRFSKLARAFFASILLFSLLASLGLSVVPGQSRRQPPTSTEKKNKRPAETGQPGEKPEEPLPPDFTGKPQEAEKITVSTQIVNEHTVACHKKSGQSVTGFEKQNFSVE